MKVKIISFVLMLLMITCLIPVPVSAAVSNSGLMCTNFDEHKDMVVQVGNTNTYVSAIYTCPGCLTVTTFVCRICYPNHTHASSNYCSVHNKFTQLCSTCLTYHCPDPSHGHYSTNYYYCTLHPTTAYAYCSYCASYYCPSCYGGNHTHGGVTSSVPFYCTYHTTPVLSTYCAICKTYYCASCYGNYHNHSYYGSELKDAYFVCKKHSIDVGATQCNYCGYYYCTTCYGGYHNHGTATPSVTTCETPIANISNGSNVAYGTRISLTTGTSNANIYYTTDGTVPTSTSARYTGPITLTKNTTIRAIAIKSGSISSSVATFKYTIKAKISFTDISGYPGLSDSLSVLVDSKVINDSGTFNPSGTFTFGELELWLAAIGAGFDGVTNIDHFEDDDELSYNDFVYVAYKALRKADLIKTPKSSGYQTLKVFTYNKDITNASFYKAGFVSFYENGLFYDVNFKPNDSATRAYLATAIAAVVTNNDL